MVNERWLRTVIEQALQEDMPFGDVTTEAIVPVEAKGKAVIVAKAEGIICGLPVAKAVFAVLDENVGFDGLVNDGDKVAEGTVIAEVQGSLRALLMGERTALNFL